MSCIENNGFILKKKIKFIRTASYRRMKQDYKNTAYPYSK